MTTTEFNSENIGNIEDMITDVSFCTSLSMFAAEAKGLFDYADKNNIDVEYILDDLYEEIKIQYITRLENTQCQFLRDDSAVRMFMYTDWTAFIEENASSLYQIYIKDLILEISHNEGRKVDNDKSENLIEKLIELVQAEINILDMLPDNHSVNIAFVDQPETRYEGYIGYNMHFLPERTYHQIIVSNFTDDKTDVERIHGFIKAMGYIYLFSLTGSFKKMPKDFFSMKKLFSSEINSDVELFAECFSMALCMTPSLNKYDFRPDISLDVKQQVYEYIMGLGKHRLPVQFHIKQTQFPS